MLSGNRRVIASLRSDATVSGRFNVLIRCADVLVIEVPTLERHDVTDIVASRVGMMDDVSVDRIARLIDGKPKVLTMLLDVLVDQQWFQTLPGGLLHVDQGLPCDPRLERFSDAETGSVDDGLIADLAAVGAMDVLATAQPVEAAVAAGVVIEKHTSRGTMIELASPLVSEVWRSRHGATEVLERRVAYLDRFRILRAHRSDGATDKSDLVDDPVARRVLALVAAQRGVRDDVDFQALSHEARDALDRGDPEAVPLTTACWRHHETAQTALDASLTLEHNGRPADSIALAERAQQLAADDEARAVAIDRQASALVRLGHPDDALAVLEAGMVSVSDAESIVRLQVSIVTRMLHRGQVAEVGALVEPFLALHPVPPDAALIGAIAHTATGRPALGRDVACGLRAQSSVPCATRPAWVIRSQELHRWNRPIATPTPEVVTATRVEGTSPSGRVESNRVKSTADTIM